jgi:septation ring formation regulator EzrA
MGNSEIEDSLERLDKLTQEEARMASAEQLKMTHGVDDRVRGVEGQVQDVRDDVQDVRCDVQDARGDLRDVGNMVQDVDDKLDQANRSSSF